MDKGTLESRNGTPVLKSIEPSTDQTHTTSGNGVLTDLDLNTVIGNHVAGGVSYRNTGWQIGCCGEQVDGRSIRFFCQFILSAAVLGFSFYQLTELDECEDKQLYSSSFLAIITYWLPSPVTKFQSTN